MMRSMVVLLILSMLLIFSCKNKETKVAYLQQEAIQLVQPRIMASNRLIDSFVTIIADRNSNGTAIFYSDDGSEPTESSIKLLGEITIKDAKELKFKAFHKNFKASETASIKLFKKGHSASRIKWFADASEQYKGVGATTLINGIKASLEYSNRQWVGFDTIAKANVTFDKKTIIKSITIGYLNDPGSWIFPPSEIEIIVNNNTKNTLTFQLEPATTMTDRALLNFNVPLNQEVSILTISVKNVQEIPDWHEGKGSKAWLFMDEWIFN